VLTETEPGRFEVEGTNYRFVAPQDGVYRVVAYPAPKSRSFTCSHSLDDDFAYDIRFNCDAWVFDLYEDDEIYNLNFIYENATDVTLVVYQPTEQQLADEATYENCLDQLMDKQMMLTIAKGFFAQFGATDQGAYLAGGGTAADFDAYVAQFNTYTRELYSHYASGDMEAYTQAKLAECDAFFNAEGNALLVQADAVLTIGLLGARAQLDVDSEVERVMENSTSTLEGLHEIIRIYYEAFVAADALTDRIQGLVDAANSAYDYAVNGGSTTQQTLTDTSGAQTGIVAEGQVPPNTTLYAEPAAAGNFTVSGQSAIATYEIHLLVNGTETQPTSVITVKIPVPAGEDGSKLSVYHEENGTWVLVPSSLSADGQYRVFTASSFSKFVLAKGAASSPDPDPEPNPQPNPQPNPKDPDGDGIDNFELYGKVTKHSKTPLNWFLLIVCFGWIWMAF
jgi:hypothetical protein